MAKKQKEKPEKKALTPEQRVFCRLVAIEKMKPSQAYMQIFKCKPNSASTMAGVFLKRVEIQEEINRLSMPIQEVQEKAHIWTKTERMERLQQWAQECAGAGDIATAIKCVDTLNKMDGAYDTKAETGIGGLTAKRIMPYEAQNTAASILSKLKADHEQRLASS